MGYSGWAPGQLESELARDDWVVAPAEESFVFESDMEEMWKRAYQQRQLEL
jgi:putative transcriptional regulator